MSQFETATKIEIKNIEPKTSNGKTYIYNVKVSHTGKSIIGNFTSLDEVNQFINDNLVYRHPTWEEVTGNGKWSVE